MIEISAEAIERVERRRSKRCGTRAVKRNKPGTVTGEDRGNKTGERSVYRTKQRIYSGSKYTGKQSKHKQFSWRCDFCRLQDTAI